MRTPTLHLICGLPGSGKSTLARELEAKHSALRLTPDEWLAELGESVHAEKTRAAIEKIQWSIAQRALALGVDVILEFGFWSREERVRFRSEAHSIGAETKLYYMDVPISELKKRIARRNQSLVQDRMDPEKIEEWALIFEAPSVEE